MLNYQGVDRYATFQEHKKNIDSAPAIKTYASKFPALEYMTQGFIKKTLWVVSALPGTGKTTFLRTLNIHFSDQGVNCLWLSYEEGAENFIAKFPKIPLGGMPLEHLSRNIQWIEDKIIEAKMKDNCEIVFIDHLHYIIPPNTGMNTSMLIGEVARALVQYAQKHDVLIFLVAHTSIIKS